MNFSNNIIFRSITFIIQPLAKFASPFIIFDQAANTSPAS
ncbi:hypothetical protein ISR10_1315 [Streptococcus pyogenes]|nr:hypothetical protein GASATCC11434_0803 [Streptococcus pyogenes]SDV94044.1 hypothetical protein ISR10_1315 [Streptococcus pyogenes]SDV94336.1 hypothetical protein ISR3_1483 [Streptococcus pyogenes]